jgi:hypothetical protein
VSPARGLCAIKRSNGELNFKHVAMIGYSRSRAHDAWFLLYLHPRVYIDHVGSSIRTFLGMPAWDYRLLPFRLKSYADVWNKLLLYESVYTFRGAGRPSKKWWDSLMNRLSASSLPLLVIVIVGSTFTVLAGIGDAVGYWRRTQPTADWVFPMLVIVLFASVPNLINGVEAQRIRYTAEPVIYLAFLAFGLRLFRRCRASRYWASGSTRT